MIKKFLAFLLIISLAFLSACNSSDEGFIDADTNDTILTIGDEKVSLGKALVFIIGEKDLLEESFDSGIWSVNAYDKSLGEHLIDRMKSQIALVFSGSLNAENEGTYLSDDDKILVKKASEYFSNNLSSKSKDLLNITSEDIYDIFYSYRMAVCGYNTITNNPSIEVSVDESRVVQLQQIQISKTNLSDEEIETKKRNLNEVKLKANSGEDFAALAASFSENGSVERKYYREDLDAEFEKVIFSLTEGEVSDVIETEKYIGIYKCINSNDKNLSEANREKMLNEKKNEYYISELQGYIENHPIKWDDNTWAMIDISKISIDTEIGFFEVYDMFFPEG